MMRVKQAAARCSLRPISRRKATRCRSSPRPRPPSCRLPTGSRQKPPLQPCCHLNSNGRRSNRLQQWRRRLFSSSSPSPSPLPLPQSRHPHLPLFLLQRLPQLLLPSLPLSLPQPRSPPHPQPKFRFLKLPKLWLRQLPLLLLLLPLPLPLPLLHTPLPPHPQRSLNDLVEAATVAKATAHMPVVAAVEGTRALPATSHLHLNPCALRSLRRSSCLRAARCWSSLAPRLMVCRSI